MSYFIKIDNRERALIDYLQKEGYGFDEEALDIGDIQFVEKKSRIPLIIIERKTYPDLEASIKDGRYKEQKERMLKAYPYKVRKILLLEGEPTARNFRLPRKVLDGVMVNSMIRDHIQVFRCRNFEEICNFLNTIILNIPKYLDEMILSITDVEENNKNTIATFSNELEAYTHSVKVGKKDNLSPKICFRNMLCQISGVSNQIADAIVERYGSLFQFVNYFHSKYGEERDGMAAELGNLRMGGKSNRKIGIVSQKIVEQIFYSFDSVDSVEEATLPVSVEEVVIPVEEAIPIVEEVPIVVVEEKALAKKKKKDVKKKKEVINLFNVFSD